jgi:hypothetical protein
MDNPEEKTMRIPVLATLLLALAVGACGPRPEPLTQKLLAEARERWEAGGVDTYVLELEMRGALNERRIVDVEAGIVIDMTAGDAPAARSAWDAWSVESLFTLLERELANAESPMATYGIEDPSLVTLEASFCPKLGYPLFFRREVQGATLPIEWEVVRLDTH